MRLFEKTVQTQPSFFKILVPGNQGDRKNLKKKLKKFDRVLAFLVP